MPTFSFSITEYDPDEPWIIVSTGRDSIELPAETDFHEWSRGRWPSPRYRIQLDQSGPTPFSQLRQGGQRD